MAIKSRKHVIGKRPPETVTYRFLRERVRFLDNRAVEMTEDDISKKALSWGDRLEITGRISAFCYPIVGKAGAAYSIVPVQFPPEASEVQIASEMAHYALGQRIEPCLAVCIFESRGGIDLDSKKYINFMRETGVAQAFSGIFADNLLVQAKPEFADKMVEQNISCLREFTDSEGEWITSSSFLEGLCLQTMAVSIAALRRLVPRYSTVLDSILAEITEELFEFLTDSEISKVDHLHKLYSNLPELPNNRVDAVHLLEHTTQKAAEILEFAIPVLRYSDGYDWHYWAKP